MVRRPITIDERVADEHRAGRRPVDTVEATMRPVTIGSPYSVTVSVVTARTAIGHPTAARHSCA